MTNNNHYTEEQNSGAVCGSNEKLAGTMISKGLILVHELLSGPDPISPSEKAELNALCEEVLCLDPDNITGHFLYGYFLSETELDLKRAAAEFAKVLHLSVDKKWKENRFGFNEDWSSVAYRLGSLSVRLKSHREAIHWWERALYFNPQNESAFSALINLLLSEGNIDEATKRVMKLSPEDVMFHYYSGLISYRNNDIDTLIHNCREALKANPHHSSSQILLSVGLIYKGKFEEARGFLLDARARLELTESEEDLLAFWLITAYFRSNHSLEARIESERLLQKNPRLGNDLLSSVYAMLGECYYSDAMAIINADRDKADGLLEKALSHFETACDLYPENSEAHWCLGKYYLFVNGDRDRSYSEYIKAYELGASSETINEYFEPLIGWAERFATLRDPSPEDRNLFSSWQKLLLENLRKDPGNLKARYFLARLLFITRQYSAAIDELNRAIEIAEHQQNIPVLAELYSKLTFAYFEKGNIAEGLKVYERFEAKQPMPHKLLLKMEEDLKGEHKNWENFFSLGKAYAAIGHYQEAETLLLKSLGILEKKSDTIKNQNFVSILWALADVALQQGQLKEARDLYYKVLKEEPRNVEIMHSLAGVLRNLKEYSKVKTIYEKILKLNPQNSIAANEYADLCMIMSQDAKGAAKNKYLAKAEKLYYKALNMSKDAGTYYDLAVVYQKKNDIYKAIDMALEAIKISPQNPGFFQFLTELYEDLGAYTTARLLKIHSAKYFQLEKLETMEIVGRANGLWVTEDERLGGLITIQASVTPGSGRFTRTGNILKVMRESTDVAYTYVKENAGKYGIVDFAKNDIHLHFVSSGTAAELKEGPSAGIAIATSLISALGKYSVKPRVAMTGELFLNGMVGRVGGIEGKIRGAFEAGMTSVCIPHENAPDFHNLSASTFTPEIVSKMEFIFVRTIEDVLKHALTTPIVIKEQ